MKFNISCKGLQVFTDTKCIRKEITLNGCYEIVNRIPTDYRLITETRLQITKYAVRVKLEYQKSLGGKKKEIVAREENF